MVKHQGGYAYLFAVNMRDATTIATLHLGGLPASATVEVINESRSLTAVNGTFSDSYVGYAVHLYRVTLPPGPSITSWQTVSTHGNAGELATPVVDGSVESRLAGLRTLRITFSKALSTSSLADGAVTIAGATSGPVTVPASYLTLNADRTMLTVTLPSALADGDIYTVTVTGLVTGDGIVPLTGDLVLTVAARAGDVNSDGTLSEADLLAARAAAGPTTTANARYDVDSSGAVTGNDLLAIRARLAP
jgi:hypothetical protein